MEKAFHEADWMSMEATYSADGPDGSDLGYSRDGLLCVIEGRWGGGDDSDPTAIPGPEFDVFVTCAPLRADDQPPLNGYSGKSLPVFTNQKRGQ
jgi:hypothetical protein